MPFVGIGGYPWLDFLLGKDRYLWRLDLGSIPRGFASA
jgi:hypothetical protein